MKKLICLITLAALLLSSCALFPRAVKNQDSLIDKLGKFNTAQNSSPPPDEPEYEPITYDYIDPYDVSALWLSSHSISTFASATGVAYDAAETKRMDRQADYVKQVFSAPFDNIYPGMEYAKCYAFVAPSNNLFGFDYKHYPFADASAAEIAAIYYDAVGMIEQHLGNQPAGVTFGDFDNQVSEDWFDRAQMEEWISTAGREFYFSTIFALDKDIYLDVLLIKRDEILSLGFSYSFPLDEQPQYKEQATPSALPATPAPSQKPQPTTNPGRVSFIGITNYDGDEGAIELIDYDATSNGRGGYDCYITLANRLPDMTKIAIDVWLYGGYEEADIITLAEPAAFHSGASDTFYFEIPAQPANGVWEVLVEYRFW